MTTLFEKIKNIIKEDLQVGMEKKTIHIRLPY